MSFNWGTAAAYSLLAQSGITNASGTTAVSGGVIGTSGATITGFNPPPAVVDNTDAAQAVIDGFALYNSLVALTFQSLGGSIDLSTANGSGGNTYTPGNYSFGAALMSTGIVLNGPGVYIFKGSSTINLASGQSITLTNGATAANVYWLVGSSLTTVATSNFVGNILAFTSITLGGGTLNGRALAVGTGAGAVTISSATTITTPSELPPAPVGQFNISGSGPADAQIQCVPVRYNAANPQILFTLSDPAGNWSFQVVPGSYYLTATDGAADPYWYHHRANVIVTTTDVSNVNLSASL